MRSNLKKALFFCSCLLMICTTFLLYERNRYNLISSKELKEVREKLAFLTVQEKQDLAHFLNHAILFDQYAYTLVDAKPMSICNFLQEAEDLPPAFKAEYERPLFRKFEDALERGLCVLEKYQYKFPFKKYLILRHHRSISKGTNEIALMNFDLCLAKIDQNKSDFCEILGKPCSSKEIFQILTTPDHESFYKLMEHHRLLGTLLGFGRNNAYLFENNNRIKLRRFTNEWPVWPRKWRLPGFACDHTTEETKQLKKLYNSARKNIRWTYFFRNEVEVTLALLSKEK